MAKVTKKSINNAVNKIAFVANGIYLIDERIKELKK